MEMSGKNTVFNIKWEETDNPILALAGVCVVLARKIEAVDDALHELKQKLNKSDK